MAVKTLILGESGTGKSTSLRNFDPGEVCYINPTKKPLPFKGGKFETLSGTTDVIQIIKFIRKSNKKIVVIDDGQYIMSFPYMYRIKEGGWDKFSEIQSDYFQLIDLADNLPDDVTVYFLSHLQIMEDGRQKIKTIGKMLDEKITIEGMFTTVLKTYVSDGKYYFVTQNSGNDTVKSPMGMFPTFAIDNDLKYVDEKIRNYYEIGEDFKSDEEMAQADEKVKNEEIEKPVNGKKRRNKAGEESTRRSTREKGNKPENEAIEPQKEDDKIEVVEGEPIPFDEVPESEFNPPVENKRKSRKKSE